MKILIMLMSYNDEDVIDRGLACALTQTYPADVLLVDSGSTDSTVKRRFPDRVSLIKQSNTGSSGAVATGLRYATEKGYEGVWVLDADSRPNEKILQTLIHLYESVPALENSHIGVVCCAHLLIPSMVRVYGRMLTPGGPRLPHIDPRRPYVDVDSTIWSGSLFIVDAVRDVGLPRYDPRGFWVDFGTDYGDLEYTYRIKHAGWRVLVDTNCWMEHPVGNPLAVSGFGISIYSTNHSAERRYLYFRNLVFYWVYVYPRRQWLLLGLWFMYRFGTTILKIMIVESTRWTKLRACFLGVRDGLAKRMEQRYDLHNNPVLGKC